MSDSAQNSGLRLRPFPLEIYGWSVAAVTVVALRWWGLQVGWNTVEYTLGPFFSAAPKLLLLGVSSQVMYRLVVALFQRQGLASIRTYLRALRSPAWFVLWFRLFVVYGLTNYVYFWIKVSVPLLNYRLWDELLGKIDRIVHLGLSPSVFLVELFAGTPLVNVLDWWYSIYIYTVMGVIAFFACARRSELRRSFILSCALLWTSGAVLYLLVPVLGPVYSDPKPFEEVLLEMPGAARGQEALARNYNLVLEGREGPLRQFNPTRGIAALPSLHVAAHFLFVLWVRRFARPLYAISVLAVSLTFVGSIVSGWHYAVDGYAGVALGFAAYWVARRFEPIAENQEDESARP